MATVTVPGLSSAEAAERLAAEGPNQLPEAPRPAPALLLLHQLTHFFAIMLWGAAGLAVLAGLPPLAVAIAVVVLLNGVFAFVQEYRADRAAERLRKLLPTRATVIRDGRPVVRDAVAIVREDLVLLTAGDRISADITLLETHELAVDESLLTGESMAVHPQPGDAVFAGTFVVEGEAQGLVTATGAATRLASIATLTRRARRPPSPLTRQLHRVVTVIAVIAVCVGVLLFAVSVLLGLSVTDGFLFGVGVAVALVPEGLLPTVTLSLARGAQRMASRQALVRRLDAVETLGATTFICTDKTGTLTRNEMSVVEIWTTAGRVLIDGVGYEPSGRVRGTAVAVAAAKAVAISAARPVRGHAVMRDGVWLAEGDPMEVALDVLLRRLGLTRSSDRVVRRIPFSPHRRFSGLVDTAGLHVLGAPEAVIPTCDAIGLVGGAIGTMTSDGVAALEAVRDLAHRGRRVLAVAHRPPGAAERPDDPAVSGLTLLGLIGLEDPPREDVADAVSACRQAGIRVAMVTGDHPGTAVSVAREVGLLRPGGPVVQAAELPAADADLAALLDDPRGAVVARVTPEEKLRIARALQGRGHVVAMTGDGVNDAPALGVADVGVAMGASGSDVAREAAELVLLDDRFSTIVSAIELGRATFSNMRKFLTYHLTDNVAELTPFAVWALTGGSVPLAVGVLQVLALDIGTDMLPALGLGAEPPTKRALSGRARMGSLIDAQLLRRTFGVLGPVEAALSMTAFLITLHVGGWRYGETPAPGLLAVASGTAFASIALGQFGNAFACRSASRPFWTLSPSSNPLLLWAVGTEAGLLVGFLAIPPLADLLGGSWPTLQGWALAAASPIAVLLADSLVKLAGSRRAQRTSVERMPQRIGPPGG